MGVLAFGDSSTWALQRDGSTTGALATAKARRAARFGDGTVPESREADGADGPGRAGVTPRNAWPEGTFTITYPRGYDPARGGFVRGGEGDEEARVRVEKAPARARRRRRRPSRRGAPPAEAASRSAAEALGLDEAYLERVRAQRREATRRRDERKKRGDLSFATTSRTEEMRSVAARRRRRRDGGDASSRDAGIGTQKKKSARRRMRRTPRSTREVRRSATQRARASPRPRGGGQAGRRERGDPRGEQREAQETTRG